MAYVCSACKRTPEDCRGEGDWWSNLTIMFVKGNPALCPRCRRLLCTFLKAMGLEITKGAEE